MDSVALTYHQLEAEDEERLWLKMFKNRGKRILPDNHRENGFIIKTPTYFVVVSNRLALMTRVE